MKLLPLTGFSGDPGNLLFIKALPRDREYVLHKVRKVANLGSTNETNERNYILIAFLVNTLCTLSQRYPEDDFTNGDLRSYYENLVLERYAFHRKTYPSDGTLYSVCAGFDVIKDLETRVSAMVSALTMYEDDFDYAIWKKRWEKEFPP